MIGRVTLNTLFRVDQDVDRAEVVVDTGRQRLALLEIAHVTPVNRDIAALRFHLGLHITGLVFTQIG